MLTSAAKTAPYGVPPISVAPMMDRTDRHFRFFMRTMTRHALLYTEMVTTGAIIHGDRARLLVYDPAEHPVALQLGGDDPQDLATCARIAEDFGYDEINLNVGCPSDRVQRGNFGACLMKTPELVAECVAAMRAAVKIPVTVKHRIGVDELDRYEDMLRFVDTVAAAGVTRFSVHARKAWLSGLSPKENRTVPPLRYEDVYRLKRERPGLFVELNGGVVRWDHAEQHLEQVDAVMVGRAAYEDPYLFTEVDRRFFGSQAEPPSRREIVLCMCEYAEAWVRAGGKLHAVSRHLLPLWNGVRGTRAWKRHIAENAPREGADSRVLLEALEKAEADSERGLRVDPRSVPQ